MASPDQNQPPGGDISHASNKSYAETSQQHSDPSTNQDNKSAQTNTSKPLCTAKEMCKRVIAVLPFKGKSKTSTAPANQLEANEKSPSEVLEAADTTLNKDEGDKKSSSEIKGQKKSSSEVIEADLNYIRQGAYTLNKYKDQLDSNQKMANDYFKSLEKDDDSLRELKAAITKLKLKIPAKFRVEEDEIDPEKKLKLAYEAKRVIPKELDEIKPRLYEENTFESSVEFKDFEDRYNELSNRMKLCLLCFSIFPEDAVIKRTLMQQWWVSEGYASEETAATNFEELLKRGFIEPVNKNKSPKVKECRMLPFYRSVLAVLAHRAMFFNFDKDGEPTQDFLRCSQSCLVKDGVISYQDLEREYRKEGEEAASRKRKEAAEKQGKGVISVKKILKKVHPIFSVKETKKAAELEGKEEVNLLEVLEKTLKKVHLIFNVKEAELGFKDRWFSMMKNVNFMHLGNWRSSDHVEVDSTEFFKEGGTMKYLKFLSLQGVANIMELPPSFSKKFANLEILNLAHCHNLEKIPENIYLLHNLTHLDMSECSLLVHMPRGLRRLVKLEVLKGFVVDYQDTEKKKCSLKDLCELEKLRKLCIYTGLANFPAEDEHAHALEKLVSLEKLSITWGVTTDKERPGESSGNSDLPLKLPESLKKLELKCFPSTPNRLTFKNLAPLGLKKLYIRGGDFKDLGQYQVAEARDWFPAEENNVIKWETVTDLRLKFLSKIEMEWGQLRELFPSLKYLEQVDCPKLTFFQGDANGIWTEEGLA